MPIFMSRERRSWDYWCRNFVSSHEIRGKLSDQRLLCRGPSHRLQTFDETLTE